MSRVKNLFIVFSIALILCCFPCTETKASNDIVAVLPQSVTEYYSSYSSVFKDAFSFDIANITPGYTYDIYYKPSKSKRWKLYKTYTARSEEYEDFWEQKGYRNVKHFWITKVAPNTKYNIKVKTRNTNRWTKTATFWSTTKSPKYKRSGRRVTWNKVSGASGYIVGMKKFVYWEWHDGMPVWVNDYKYYTAIVSNKTRAYTCKNGYNLIGVYAYNKHGKYYYVDGYGLFTRKKELKNVAGWPERIYKLRKRHGLNWLFDA